MRNLSAAELLTAWERALGQSVAKQALVLLGAVFPDRSQEELATWSVGRRDACLLALRERLFGSQINGVSVCPRCEERVELVFQVSDIRVDSGLDPIEALSEPLTLLEQGYEIDFRLLNSLDLISIEDGSDLGEARQRLIARCIQSAVRTGAGDGEAVEDVGQLPEPVVEAIAQRMAIADPQADTRLSLDCSNCGHTWVATFDIAAYLVGEIRTWVRRVLREVHDLARAYGWSEADILAMTPTRRRSYLELLADGS